MKWTALIVFIAALGAGAAAAAEGPARAAVEAEAGKLVGSVTAVTMAEDGKSATAVLKDSKSGKETEIFVDDQVTLEKFTDKRISAGDEIRCKWELKDGRKHSTYFRKVGGC